MIAAPKILPSSFKEASPCIAADTSVSGKLAGSSFVMLGPVVGSFSFLAQLASSLFYFFNCSDVGIDRSVFEAVERVEFGMTDRTARSMINVASRLSDQTSHGGKFRLHRPLCPGSTVYTGYDSRVVGR